MPVGMHILYVLGRARRGSCPPIRGESLEHIRQEAKEIAGTMDNIDFSKLTTDEVIKKTYSLRPGCDDHCDGICELERRKKEREDAMLTMTENLVTQTDKMVIISKRTLFVAIGSFVLAFLAIVIALWKW